MPRSIDQEFPEAVPSSRPLDYFLNLLFPDRCLICRTILPSVETLPLCNSCQKTFSPAGQICPQCERFFNGQTICTCHPAVFPLQSLFALTRYGQQWRPLLHDLKYRSRRSLARPFGVWLAHEIIKQEYCTPNVIVPIPLHKRREKERGFNQSALVACHMARILGIPCQQLLVKNKDTASQTMISRLERRENIHGAFSCTSALPQDSVVLLIDDIYSTGATMKEAAAVLYGCGAKVFGAVIAYNSRIS